MIRLLCTQDVFRTERIQNNRNPRFERIMRINYFKATNDRVKEPQPIRFVIAVCLRHHIL